ncbi:MAG: thiamine pyrophosphate-dependent dehydrogenase E1 component subunit alpha [Candidatus Omnitrophica bacterium]|jgi:pyruvate dehydrogenase E1 component alpha subunit|nr:thiamine pyrophosphate-dependent dehydrogenase E1 component subunit alpha [Candidatus Omnitrophota bacterium]
MRKDLNIQLYKKMYLIRVAEEQIREYYPEDEMKTPMHMSMGAEAIAAGVCHALNNADQIFTTYRSHAGFLAKTADVGEFFSEMYAKDTSSVKGKGGSMHLCLPNKGFMGTSAIVSAHIPVAVGCAWANKINKNKRIVVVFFGDGATDEGGFWESINLASLMRIPVIFVCEDNELAVHTFAKKRRGYDSITQIIEKFHCGVIESDTTDVEEIYNLVSNAITLVRKKPRPYFMNFKYYRYLEHVGINYDFDAGYRSKKQFQKWFKKDPVFMQRLKLLRNGIDECSIRKIESEMSKNIVSAIENAKKAAVSGSDQLHKGVFNEDN